MITSILEPTERNVARAADALRHGEIVGMPTETVYGLAAPCYHVRAVAQIFAVKERPRFDPLIVHVAGDARSVAALADLGLVDAAELCDDARRAADALCAAFWPGPLTVVLPKTPRVPDIVTALVPALGYERSSEIARDALATGTPVRDLVLARGYLGEQELDELLSPEAMTRPRPMVPRDGAF